MGAQELNLQGGVSAFDIGTKGKAMESRSTYGSAAKPMAVLVQLLGITVSALLFLWSVRFRGGLAFRASNKTLINVFNIHPVLMFSGFIFVASEAILAYRIIPGSKQVQKKVRVGLQGVAIILGGSGVYAAFKYHADNNIGHMYTLHSRIGLLTFSLFALQWLGGFVGVAFLGGWKSGRGGGMPWQTFLGLLIHLAAIVAAELGLVDAMRFLEWTGQNGKQGYEAKLVDFTRLLMLVFGMVVVLAAIIP